MRPSGGLGSTLDGRTGAVATAGVVRVARRDRDRVPGKDERRGERAADVAGTDDGDIHARGPPGT